MTAICFTKFTSPDGCRTEISIDRPEAVGDLARRLNQRGYDFGFKYLPTGEVALAISYEEENQDIEIVANGLKVPDAVDHLIERFAARVGGGGV